MFYDTRASILNVIRAASQIPLNVTSTLSALRGIVDPALDSIIAFPGRFVAFSYVMRFPTSSPKSTIVENL